MSFWEKESLALRGEVQAWILSVLLSSRPFNPNCLQASQRRQILTLHVNIQESHLSKNLRIPAAQTRSLSSVFWLSIYRSVGEVYAGSALGRVFCFDQERPNAERDHVERGFSAKPQKSELCGHQCPLHLC